MSGAGIYLHGFTADGKSVGQGGPYFPDQEAAIANDRKSLKRMGARHIVSVTAADHSAAAILAEQAFAEQADEDREPFTISDRIGRAVAAISMKVIRPRR